MNNKPFRQTCWRLATIDNHGAHLLYNVELAVWHRGIFVRRQRKWMLKPAHGVAVGVGVVVGEPVAVGVVVGEPVGVVVGVEVGVATALGAGIAIIVGSGVTGKTFVGVLGSVGKAGTVVGVNP